MGKEATRIRLTREEKETLESWIRSSRTEQRKVFRARIILAASQGQKTREIAESLGVRPATVSKWRTRFAADRLSGLNDAPRPGARPIYDQSTEKRILAKLEDPPPPGSTTWTGKSVAAALGDVSPHQVWRVLSRHGINLQRRRDRSIRTDTEFAIKAADIVGLYLDPPENALVLCLTERPALPALERNQGWLRVPDGKAVTGFNHEYKQHGHRTLLKALNIAAGQIKAGHYKRRGRREFLDFINEVVSQYPDQEIHVLLDGLRADKPKNDHWLARHQNVRLHFIPNHSEWLNQTETWLTILRSQTLRPSGFTWPQQVRKAIGRFIKAHNKNAAPFEWKKGKVRSVHPKCNDADLDN